MAYEKLKATASVTIVDETDASTLVSNMVVVKGSKNQIYITGQDNPYSPDWTKNNLVIRSLRLINPSIISWSDIINYFLFLIQFYHQPIT